MYLRLLSWFLNCVCLSFVLQFDNVLVQPDGRGTLCLVARIDQNFWMNRIVRFDVRIGSNCYIPYGENVFSLYDKVFSMPGTTAPKATKTACLRVCLVHCLIYHALSNFFI
jgi:hypothetical protein